MFFLKNPSADMTGILPDHLSLGSHLRPHDYGVFFVSQDKELV